MKVQKFSGKMWLELKVLKMIYRELHFKWNVYKYYTEITLRNLFWNIENLVNSPIQEFSKMLPFPLCNISYSIILQLSGNTLKLKMCGKGGLSNNKPPPLFPIKWTSSYFFGKTMRLCSYVSESDVADLYNDKNINGFVHIKQTSEY